MKITIAKPAPGQDNEIIINCHNISPAILDLLNLIKMQESSFVGYLDEKIYNLFPNDIYYMETNENKTFIYTKDEVYESKQRLYEFEEAEISHFFRVSKSVVINLSKIKTLMPIQGRRIEATLKNGERQIISRQYSELLKEKLKL